MCYESENDFNNFYWDSEKQLWIARDDLPWDVNHPRLLYGQLSDVYDPCFGGSLMVMWIMHQNGWEGEGIYRRPFYDHYQVYAEKKQIEEAEIQNGDFIVVRVYPVINEHEFCQKGIKFHHRPPKIII